MNAFLRDERNFFVILFIFALGILPFSRSLSAIGVGILAVHTLLQGLFRRDLKNRFEAAPNPIAWMLLAGYFGLLCLGVLYTQNIAQAVIDLRIAAPLLFVPIAVALSPKLSKRQIDVIGLGIAYACALGLAVSIAYAFRIYFITGLTRYFYYHLLVTPLDLHSIYFSWYVATALIIVANYIVTDWRRLSVTWRTLHIVLFSFLLIGLFLLASRTIVFALVGIILVALFLWSLKKFKWYVGLGITIGAVAIVFASISFNGFLRNRYDQIIHSDLSVVYKKNYYGREDGFSELTLRLCTWRFTQEALADYKWITGVGTGDAQDEIVMQMRKVWFARLYYGLNPHNQYLQSLLMIGIGGLLVLLAGLLVPLWQSWRQNNWSYLMWLLLTMALFLTESVLVRTNGILFYAAMSSLFAVHSLQTKNT